MEEYKGIKFKVVELEGEIPNKEKLLELDKLISKFIKTEKNEGNLSVRMKNGFLIKKAGSQLTKLKENDVIMGIAKEASLKILREHLGLKSGKIKKVEGKN